MMIVACGGDGGGIKKGSGGSTGTSAGAGTSGTSAGADSTGTSGGAGTTATSGGAGTAGTSGDGGTAGTSGSGGSAGSGGTCVAVAACGGDIEGTWDITSSCIIGDVIATMAGSVASLPAACNDFLQDFAFSLEGSMTFANGTLTSNVITTTWGKEHVTPACMSALQGVTVSSVSASTCSDLEDSLSESGSGNSASCRINAGNCDCDVTMVSDGASDDKAYALSDNQVVDPSGDDRPMDYCVSGNTLTLVQTHRKYSDTRLVITLRRK